MDQDLPVPFLGLRFAGDGLTFLAAFLAGTFPCFSLCSSLAVSWQRVEVGD